MSHLHLVRPAAAEQPPEEEYFFDEHTHRYYYRPAGSRERVEYLGVTRILNAAGLTDYSWMRAPTNRSDGERRLPPEGFPGWKRYYLWRGGAVHAATLLVDNGQQGQLEEWYRRLRERALDGEIRVRVDAYKQFLFDVRPKVMLREERLYDHGLHLAGTLDRTMLLKRGPALPDLKCSEQRATAIQTAAYEKMLGWTGEALGYIHADDEHIRFGLELRADGRYDLHWYDEAENWEDHQLFLSAVAIASWQQRWTGRLRE